MWLCACRQLTLGVTCSAWWQFQAPVDGVIKYLGNGTEYGAAVSVTCTRANTEAFRTC